MPLPYAINRETRGRVFRHVKGPECEGQYCRRHIIWIAALQLGYALPLLWRKQAR